MSQKNVYEWYRDFKEGRERVDDFQRSGRPSTSIDDQNINKIKEMVVGNRRLTIRELADMVGISFGSVQTILKDHLGIRRIKSSLVAKPKRPLQSRSKVKVMLTVFFDCRGVVHYEFLPTGQTVNKEYYLSVMRHLREAIRKKTGIMSQQLLDFAAR